MSDDAWPPDWRERAADAGEALLIRSGIVLAELDELCELMPSLAPDARALAARIRCERGDLQDRIETLRAAGRDRAML